jgi:hypothetical protein
MKRRSKMFCSIYKWKISQAIDSGKPTSGKVQKHMSKCETCREYAKLCTSLKPKFTQDKNLILKDFDKGLNKKIMAAIPEKPEPGHEQERKDRASSRPFQRPALIPSLAAVVCVVALSIGILYFALPRAKQTPRLGQISTLISAASPENMLLRVESPLEKEYAELKRAFESTGKFLMSSFEFRIGQQAK